MSEIAVGDVCLTNLSKPGGLVKVLRLDPCVISGKPRTFAWIEHVEDHPYGYEKGSTGGYYTDELIFVRHESEEAKMAEQTAYKRERGDGQELERALSRSLEKAIRITVRDEVGALRESVATLTERLATVEDRLSPMSVQTADKDYVMVDGVTMTSKQYAALKDVIREAMQAMHLGDNLASALNRFGEVWNAVYLEA